MSEGCDFPLCETRKYSDLLRRSRLVCGTIAMALMLPTPLCATAARDRPAQKEPQPRTLEWYDGASFSERRIFDFSEGRKFNCAIAKGIKAACKRAAPFRGRAKVIYSVYVKGPIVGIDGYVGCSQHICVSGGGSELIFQQATSICKRPRIGLARLRGRIVASVLICADQKIATAKLFFDWDWASARPDAEAIVAGLLFGTHKRTQAN